MSVALLNKKVWIFDLDSTLYPKDCGFEASRQSYKVFAKLKGVSDDVAKDYYAYYANKYGAAPFTGIYNEGGIDLEAFIQEAFVNVPMDILPVSEDLPDLLAQLNGRKVLFSNCPQEAVDRILTHLGIAGCFDDVFSLERLEYLCKPHKRAFQFVLDTLAVSGDDCVMVEDQSSNLKVAKSLGMTTVLVHGDATDDFIDFQFDTIEHALKG